MPKRKYLIHLPVFSEYMFRLLTTLREDRKQKLSNEERVMLATVDDIRAFCAREPLEKLLFIFTKIGEEWGLIFGPTQQAIQDSMESCRYQYDSPLNRLHAVDAIRKEKVCAISSREVMQLVQMCAQNCHTENYRLTYLMTKTKRTTNKLKQAYDIEVQEAGESLSFMNKLMMEQLKSMEYAKDVLGLPPMGLLILLTLYENKNGAYSMKELLLILNAESSKTLVKQQIIALDKSGLAMSDRDKRGVGRWSQNVYYSITTKGIQTIMEYHFKILEKAQN